MEAELGHRLVIGPGCSGRSHRLRSWAEELDGGEPTWLVARPSKPVEEAAVKAALEQAAASEHRVLIVDDLQWVSEDGLRCLADNRQGLHVWASRRPWPTGPTMRALNDLLTERQGAERTGTLPADLFANAVGKLAGRALNTELVDRWFEACGGSVGFGADALASSWDANLSAIGEELLDAVTGRIERAGPRARSIVRLMAVGTDLEAEVVLAALDDGVRPSDAEREARAGGLLDQDGRLLPIVQAVVLADLTTTERAELHDRLASALAPRRPDLAVEHILAGSTPLEDDPTSQQNAALVQSAIAELAITNPGHAIDLIEAAVAKGLNADDFALARAQAAFSRGDLDALSHLEAVPADAPAEEVGHLAFALDVRDLRLGDAVGRPIDGALANSFRALAGAMIEPPADARVELAPGDDVAGPHIEMMQRMVAGLDASSVGDAPRALGHFAAAADDHDRLRPRPSFGMTPHAVGALGALLAGDVPGADLLLTQAVGNDSGGVGEEVSHRLLLAYARSVDGQFHDALAAVREGEDASWAQRDRLLLAVLDAALARRSGDTTRLREAWRRADPVLARQTTGWILIDPLTEILAAGARIGDRQRIDPIIAGLVEAACRLPAEGPGPVAAHWLRLQVALAREDKAGVQEAQAAMQTLRPAGHRAQARVAAAAVWVDLLDRTVNEEVVAAVANQLVAVGDKWEASRLLGQGALDHADPKVARSLLEAARALMSEAFDHASGDGLSSLGLSEREVDVTRLVAEGRTYKEVGAQLFISPKTVEHHVARIRQKLGANSRAEFLSIVREAMDGSPS